MGKLPIKRQEEAEEEEVSDSEADDDGDENEAEQGEETEISNDGDEGIAEEESDADRPVKRKKVHKLSLTETTQFNEELKKRGVIYIARIPPRMTPTKVKALLSEFGEVTRIYLVEEDPTVRKRRKKEHGKSGGKRYVEGWVEMTNKEKAKHIAQSLNNTSISNHKRNPHYGRFTIGSLS
jgi:ESF2/ABP1 family protein